MDVVTAFVMGGIVAIVALVAFLAYIWEIDHH